MATVLIADDAANLRKVLAAMLGREGHKSVCVADGQAALSRLAQGGIDLIITDLKMPGVDGLELLTAVKRLDAALPVIVITAHGTVDTAVAALKKGAFDYITKPFEREELELAVRKAAAVAASTGRLSHDPGDAPGRFRLVGLSPAMAAIYDIIDRVADAPSTVLITGESGTGKELVAAALHGQSGRRDRALIKVNCGAIPKDLVESEFFGYERGAFTGAVAAKPGRFELADGGTLFLDEIAEICTATQVKLLRALQEGEFTRVGGVRSQRVDVRLIAATNQDLPALIKRGAFREDLYYRLNVVPICVPPLRQRPQDIAPLAQHFIDKHNRRLGTQVTGIEPAALAALAAYTYPGNIRELENTIERALIFVDGPLLRLAQLPRAMLGPQREGEPSAVATGSLKERVREATVHLERELIAAALGATAGNVTQAATRLMISRKGLQNKMRDLGLRDPELGP